MKNSLNVRLPLYSSRSHSLPLLVCLSLATFTHSITQTDAHERVFEDRDHPLLIFSSSSPFCCSSHAAQYAFNQTACETRMRSASSQILPQNLSPSSALSLPASLSLSIHGLPHERRRRLRLRLWLRWRLRPSAIITMLPPSSSSSS